MKPDRALEQQLIVATLSGNGGKAMLIRSSMSADKIIKEQKMKKLTK